MESMQSLQSSQSLSLSQQRHSGATTANQDSHSLTSLPENESTVEKPAAEETAPADDPPSDLIRDPKPNRDSVNTMTEEDLKPDRDSVRTITEEMNGVQLSDQASNGETSTDDLIDTSESKTTDTTDVTDSKTDVIVEKKVTISECVNGSADTETAESEESTDHDTVNTEPNTEPNTESVSAPTVTNGGHGEPLKKATSDAQLDAISQTSSALDDTTDQGWVLGGGEFEFWDVSGEKEIDMCVLIHFWALLRLELILFSS